MKKNRSKSNPTILDPLSGEPLTEPVILAINHPKKGKVCMKVNKKTAETYSKLGNSRSYVQSKERISSVNNCDLVYIFTDSAVDGAFELIRLSAFFADYYQHQHLMDIGFSGGGGVFDGGGSTYSFEGNLPIIDSALDSGTNVAKNISEADFGESTNNMLGLAVISEHANTQTDVTATISEMTSDAASNSEGIIDGVIDTASGVFSAVGDMAGSVFEVAGDVAGGAAEVAGDVLGGIAECIGDILS